MLANMHDGLVLQGEIPVEAVERACQLSDIVRTELVELVEKPYK